MHLNPTHLSDGEIRTFQDGQFETNAAQRAEAHLSACPACRSRAHALQEQALRVHSQLGGLNTPNLNPIKTSAARRQLAERLQNPMEEPSMLKKFIASISRPVWVAMALVAILAVAMAFPPVRAAANSFLQLFRVEQVRILPVDMDTMPGDMESSQQLEALFTENVEIEDGGEPQVVASREEAAALAGFPLRMPATDQQTEFRYQPGGAATFTVDLELARGVLREIGYTDIQLPDSLDGAKVRVDIPDSVLTTLGSCAELPVDKRPEPEDLPQSEPGDCTIFMQMPSPQVSAPPDMPLNELGKIYLQVLGMEEADAEIYASTVDWTTTFVLPIPRGRTEYKEVQVDGVPATLVLMRNGGKSFMLLWVKDGIVYMLTGSGGETEALNLASTIQ